jgi:hypothetical protein
MRLRDHGLLVTHTARDTVSALAVTVAVHGSGEVVVSGAAEGSVQLSAQELTALVSNLNRLGIDRLAKHPPSPAAGFESSVVTIEIPGRLRTRKLEVVGLRNIPAHFPPNLVEIDRLFDALGRRAGS